MDASTRADPDLRPHRGRAGDRGRSGDEFRGTTRVAVIVARMSVGEGRKVVWAPQSEQRGQRAQRFDMCAAGGPTSAHRLSPPERPACLPSFFTSESSALSAVALRSPLADERRVLGAFATTLDDGEDRFHVAAQEGLGVEPETGEDGK